MDKEAIQESIMISIVIPVRNRGRYLENCLLSIINQSFKDWEVIVIDYGGDDNTKALCEMFEGYPIRYIYVPEKGIWNLPRARNVGIKNAIGNLVACVDADMILGLNVFEELHKHFETHEDNVLYQIQRININEDGTKTAMPEGTFLGDFQCTTKDNFINVTGFDERLWGYGYEDLDVVIRLGRIGVRQHWLQGVETYHQWHPMSPGYETYINMIKSKLSWPSPTPGPFADKDWGCATRKKITFNFIIWRTIDKFAIALVIWPIKRFKKMIRNIKTWACVTSVEKKEKQKVLDEMNTVKCAI